MLSWLLVSPTSTRHQLASTPKHIRWLWLGWGQWPSRGDRCVCGWCQTGTFIWIHTFQPGTRLQPGTSPVAKSRLACSHKVFHDLQSLPRRFLMITCAVPGYTAKRGPNVCVLVLLATTRRHQPSFLYTLNCYNIVQWRHHYTTSGDITPQAGTNALFRFRMSSDYRI